MRISELQELLEIAKEEYGDVEIVVKHSESTSQFYDPIHKIGEAWYGNGFGYVPAIVVD